VTTKLDGAVTTATHDAEFPYCVEGAPACVTHTPEEPMDAPHTNVVPPTGVREGVTPTARDVDGVGVLDDVMEAVGEGVEVAVPVAVADGLAPLLRDAVGETEMVVLAVGVAVDDCVLVEVPEVEGVFEYVYSGGHSHPRTALLPASAMKRVPLRFAAGTTPRALALRRA
jgi:hypothetical protein